MSQYNKTVLTHAGLELAKRANAGQAKFGITRAVTSADDWSHKTVQDLEEVTTIPNIMQQGTIMDTEEVESNNSVIGVSLCFANKDLNTSYQIRIIGLYAKEEGQENDFLYAVTTAVTPEYMPDFSDEVLYRFNMQMYLVIGKAQAVNVVINDGSSVTHGQLDKYKSEVTANLKKIENTHKEDMSHVVKSANINGGDDILPDEAGKLKLVVPAPDLSKYVSLEQLTETLKTKADITAIPDKTATEEGIKQAKELAQEADTKAQNALDNKADKTDVNAKIKAVTDLANTKADASDVYTKADVNGKTSGTIITAFDVASKTPTEEIGAYNHRQLVDQGVLGQFADAINAINGTNRIANAVDVNTLTGEAGKVHVYLLPNSDNTNTPNWVSDHRGDLIVINYDGNAKTQLWFPVGSGNDKSIGVRYWEGNNYPAWNRIAIQSDINSLLDQVNDAKNTANWDNINGRPQDQINRINVEGPLFKQVTQFNNWGDLFDGYSFNGFTATNGNRLVAFRDDTNSPNLVGGNSSGIGFGGGDTKSYLSVSYDQHRAIIGGGNGNAPLWHEDVAWKSDVNDLRNQIRELRENQFEVQTFTDATAAANWEAQRQGKRMAIVNK